MNFIVINCSSVIISAFHKITSVLIYLKVENYAKCLKKYFLDENDHGFFLATNCGTYYVCIAKPEKYLKVASRSRCYYSGNQKICILKSQLLTCPTFFRNKTFMFFKIESWNFVRFQKNFLSYKKKCDIILGHVTNWI